MAKQNNSQPNPDAVAEAERALGGGTAVAEKPTSGRAELASIAADKVLPRRRPRLGDDIVYSLGPASERAGEFRTARLTYVVDEGTVNLVWFIGRREDAPKGIASSYPAAGVEYDPTGRPGTWHFQEDDPTERPVGKKSRAEAMANRR